MTQKTIINAIAEEVIRRLLLNQSDLEYHGSKTLAIMDKRLEEIERQLTTPRTGSHSLYFPEEQFSVKPISTINRSSNKDIIVYEEPQKIDRFVD